MVPKAKGSESYFCVRSECIQRRVGDCLTPVKPRNHKPGLLAIKSRMTTRVRKGTRLVEVGDDCVARVHVAVDDMGMHLRIKLECDGLADHRPNILLGHCPDCGSVRWVAKQSR